MLGFIVYVLAVAIALSGTEPAEMLSREVDISSIIDAGLYVLVLAALLVLTAGAPELALLLGAAIAAVSFLLDRLSLRLSMSSAKEAMAHDDRPKIVYLRSFDEDGLKVPAASLSRASLFSKLAPIRKRRFEEIVVRHLRLFGPVVAASPPGARLPELGAAKANFAMESWRDEVEEWTSDSFAVVVSATPESVNEGLAWELELIAERLPHGRVVLVIAPWRKNQIQARWRVFCDYVGRFAFFQGLNAGWVSDGAQVLVRDPTAGWRVWGAHRRWEWSYAVSLHSAMQVLTASPAGDHPVAERPV